jgi:hypothetical protein
MMHHALQCREPAWSTIFDTDKELAAKSRAQLLGQVADTVTLVLPIHFPSPTVGRVAADGDRFRYNFARLIKSCASSRVPTGMPRQNRHGSAGRASPRLAACLEAMRPIACAPGPVAASLGCSRHRRSRAGS